MKAISIFAMAMCMAVSLSACESSNGTEEPVVPEVTPEQDNNGSGNDTEERTAVTLTAGETVLEAILTITERHAT